MKVILTGGTGFVGSAFKDFVREKDISLVELNREKLAMECSTWISPADMTSAPVFLHLAGSVDRYSNRNNDSFHHKSNVELTSDLFDVFLHSEAQLFIYMSSSKVMGEGSNEDYSIEDIPEPCSAYAKSKLTAERLIDKKLQEHSKNYPNAKKRLLIVRPVAIIGNAKNRKFQALRSWVRLGLPLPGVVLNTVRQVVAVETVVETLYSVITKWIINKQLSEAYFLADQPALSLEQILSKYWGVKIKWFQRWPLGFVMILLGKLGLGDLVNRLSQRFTVKPTDCLNVKLMSSTIL